MAKKLTAAEELAALKARTESYRKARDPESAIEPAADTDETPVEEKKTRFGFFRRDKAQQAAETVEDAAQTVNETVEDAAEDVAESAKDVIENAENAVENVKDAVEDAEDAVENAEDAVEDVVGNAADSAGDVVESAAEKAEDIRKDAAEALDDEIFDDDSERYGSSNPFGAFLKKKDQFMAKFRSRRSKDEYEDELPGDGTAADVVESAAGSVADAAADLKEAAVITDAFEGAAAEDIPEAAEYVFEDAAAKAGEAAPAEMFNDDAPDEELIDTDFIDDGEDGSKKSVFKKILNVFVVRNDEEYADVEDDDYEDEGAPEEDAPEDNNTADGSEDIMSGETRETTLAEQILQESEKKVESRRERRARLEAEAAQHTVEDGEASGGTKKYHLVSQHSDETADAPADDDEPEAEAADHTKQFKTASAGEYDDGEDFAEAKPRKKKLRKADYVEIDDALDDDDLDNLEYIASSKKRRKKLDEEAEEEADYDDYDGYEDDDVRRSSRRSSYEDYDGDSYEGDDSPGAMHYVLGAIKTLVAIALILVILVFILYFANQALDGGVPAYKWLSEKVPVLNRFLPVDEPEDAAPATEAEVIEAIGEADAEEPASESETPADGETPIEGEEPGEGEEPAEEEAPAPVG